MADTDIYGLPEIVEGQGSKYATHNEAIRDLEALIAPAESLSNGGPPGAPSAGNVYIVDSLTGGWSGAALGDIAHYYGGAWHFTTPVVGTLKLVKDEADSVYPYGQIQIYTGASSAPTGWEPYPS